MKIIKRQVTKIGAILSVHVIVFWKFYENLKNKISIVWTSNRSQTITLLEKVQTIFNNENSNFLKIILVPENSFINNEEEIAKIMNYE